MAFSDNLELIDQIRHEMRMEDDSGVCARVVPRVRRRANRGGLPMNFRRRTSSDEDDEELCDSYDYEIPLCEVWKRTKEIIEERLRLRTENRGPIMAPLSVDTSLSSSAELFNYRDVERVKNPADHRSAISQFITDRGPLVDNPLLTYAQFEAVGCQPSKAILILAAQPGKASGELTRMEIAVKPTTRVSEVIGYCLYRLFLDFQGPISDKVEDYQLMMADDTGEIEIDLPPLDRGRSIGDLGFTVLALVDKRKASNGDTKSSHRIVVYLTNGHHFVFELENLDATLEWLRDEALKRKQVINTKQCSGKLREMEYELEDVNVFGKPLNLQQSIGSSGCHDFILVRKYSSRGDFHPRGAMFREKSSALLTTISRSSNNLFELDRASTTRLSPCNTPGTSTEGSSPFAFHSDNGAILTFSVYRIHRLKRNWSGVLSIRWNSFDIAPVPWNRKSFLPNSNQKLTSIPWTNLADVMQLERKSEPSSVLLITWLPVLERDITGADDITPRQIVQFHGNRAWKVMMIEFESVMEAVQAKAHMMDVVRALNSSAFQTFQRSNRGSITPSQAAEALLTEMADGHLPVHPRSSKISISKKLRKLKQTLTSRNL